MHSIFFQWIKQQLDMSLTLPSPKLINSMPSVVFFKDFFWNNIIFYNILFLEWDTGLSILQFLQVMIDEMCPRKGAGCKVNFFAG